MSQESLPVPPVPRDEGQSAGPVPGSVVGRVAPSAFRFSPATIAVVGVAVLYAGVAGRLRHLTVPAELGTFLVGSLVCWRGLRGGCRRFPAPERVDRRGALVWGVVLVMFGVWELYADFRGSTPAHPTLSILMGPALASPERRSVGYLVWFALGVWVVRR